MNEILAISDLGTQLTFPLLILLILSVGVLMLLFRSISLWFRAFVSGTPIPLIKIIGMSLRKIPPQLIVNARITAYKAGLKDVSVDDLETHYLAQGNVIDVVMALIAADKARIALDWRQATAIDLAGRDVLDAVRTSVNPKVIDCPVQQGSYITAVAKDGVQLLCRARVTVRTNIAQLVGGATEDTVNARVGEGIVSSIGSADNHLQVLESPQRISQVVLEKGLDAQTAFEILSIDIADISVGDNIGAKLRADKAESDKRIAQAKAEERRALAVAMEQENIAEIASMRALVTKAEAEIPMAMAEAFRNGQLGVFDYYKLGNIRADTDMRQAISQPEKDTDKNNPQ